MLRSGVSEITLRDFFTIANSGVPSADNRDCSSALVFRRMMQDIGRRTASDREHLLSATIQAVEDYRRSVYRKKNYIYKPEHMKMLKNASEHELKTLGIKN